MKVKDVVFNNNLTLQATANSLNQLARMDAARTAGAYRVPSAAQPSNPRAFVQASPKATQRASASVSAALLAGTLGLTDGDRKFMTAALADAAKRVPKQKATPAALAKNVCEGPAFADVIAGGPLPDRDEFKDRFAAGLDAVLTAKCALADGFAADRSGYARAPRRDPKALEEIDAAVVPTSACLRCHDVRAARGPRLFETIPALEFDPLDKQARTNWARAAEPKRKQAVLARLRERVFTDADMPPQDAPEHDGFRVKQAAAFDDLRRFLDGEVVKEKGP